MIEKFVSQILQKYLYQYLKNFDQRNLNISLLRGKISLKDLQLNDLILKNVPLPVKLQYGRIGSINIELPSLMQLAHPKIKVVVSDIFICLTIKKMNEWNEKLIEQEYLEDRRSTLQQQEEDAKYIFEEYKGDDEKMNNYILKLIQNIQVEVNRIYIRLEDPIAPFAIGVLIPSIRLTTTDREWKAIDILKNEAEIMYKIIQINQFQIFLEHGDESKAQIDKVLNLHEIKGADDFDELLQIRIQRHVEDVFQEDYDPDYILHKFYIDIRFQLILDKVRAMEKYSDLNLPDIKLDILFGDLFQNFENNQSLNWIRLRVSESQLHSLIRFLTFTGLYSTFRLGVLRDVLERPLNIQSDEIQEYIKLYEEYLTLKYENKQEMMLDAQRSLFKIEKKYRIDCLFMLRKLIQERFYGMQRYQAGMNELEKYSKLSQDPYFTFDKNKFNFKSIFEFKLPKLQLEIFQDKSHNQTERRDTKAPALDCVIEGLEVTMISESKPQYKGIHITLDNIYIFDHHSKNKSLPYVIQTIISSQFTDAKDMEALEIFYEDNPKNKSAEPKIQKDISKGSFYQELLHKTVAEKQEQLYQALEQITHGNYEAPSLDLDIKIISPKVIIYEKLLCHNHSIQDRPVTIITDLGTIEVSTDLIKKQKDINYDDCFQNELLYNKMTVKFGKMRVVLDYDLQITCDIEQKYTFESNHMTNQFELQSERLLGGYKSQLTLHSKKVNWKVSETFCYILLDDVNFGFEIKTCLIPFHQKFPSQMINCKFNEIKVNISRKVFQSILIVYNAFWLGKFWTQLNLFLSQPPPKPPQLKDQWGNPMTGAQAKFELMTENEKMKEIQHEMMKQKINQRHSDQAPEDVTLLQSIKRLVFDQTIEDVKQKYKSERFDEAKKSVKIQVNMVFKELTVTYQEMDIRFEEESSYLNRYGISTEKIFEFQVSNIKGQLDLIPKMRMSYIFFLGKLLVTYMDPEQDTSIFKYLILNPSTQNQSKLSGVNKTKMNQNISQVTQSLQKMYQEIHRSPTKMSPSNYQIQVDFHEFKNFMPHVESTMQNIQLVLAYEEEGNDNEMIITLGNIRVVFIVPLIYSMYRAYADFMIDSFSFQKLIQEKMEIWEGKNKSHFNMQGVLQQQKTSLNRLKTQQSIMLERENYQRNNTNNKKLFLLDKAYLNDQQEKKQNSAKKDNTSAAFAKQASLLMKLKHDPKNQQILDPHSRFKIGEDEIISKEPIKQELKYKQRLVRSYITFKSKLLEILIPSNLHEEDSLCLRMNLMVEANICRRSLYKDAHLPDEWETWVQSLIVNDASHIDTKIKHLQIYMANQAKQSADAQFENASSLNHQPFQNEFKNERIYLLHPYDLQLMINSYTEIINDNEAYSKTHMTYKSDKVLNLTVGLCELNSYLLLGQLTFSLLNEIMRLNKEISDNMKHFNMIQKSDRDMHQDEQELKQSINEHRVDNRRLELEEILRNENLVQNSKRTTLNRWKRASKLAVASVKRKDFFELINDFQLQGIRMDFVDNVSMQNLSLVSLFLELKNLKIESRGFDVPSLYRMEHLFQIERIKDQKDLNFFKLQADITLKGTYFNRSNYFEEPFIEEFPFQFKIKQHTPMSKSKQLLRSDKMLNINLTFGMACNVQKIIKTILQMETQFKQYQDQMMEQQEEDLNTNNYNNRRKFSQRQVDPSQIIINYETPVVIKDHNPSPMININFMDLQSVENLQQPQLQSKTVTMSYTNQLIKQKISTMIMPNLSFLQQIRSTPVQKVERSQQLQFQQRVSKFDLIKEEPYNPILVDTMDQENLDEREMKEEDLYIPNERLDETIDMPHEQRISIENIFFHNHTGLRVLFCSSLYSNLLKYNRKQNKNNLTKEKPEKIDPALDYLNNDKIKCLELNQHKKEAVRIPFVDFQSIIRQFKGLDLEEQKTSIKINFKIDGFKRIRNIVLQRNGVFGYYLINQDKRKRDFLGSERSRMSCIVRIKRKDQDIHVHFESNMIIQNETKLDIKLEARELNGQVMKLDIKQGEYHQSSITWQMHKTSIWLMRESEPVHKQLLLVKKVKKTFDPQLVKPRKDPSLSLMIDDQYVAMDIFYFKTNTNIGQFLVVFQPILTLHNLMFTEILFDTISPVNSRTLLHLHTNQVKHLTIFDPYSKSENECIFKNRVSENEYFTSRINLNLSRVRRHKNMFFKKGMIVKLSPKDKQDHTRNLTAHVVFEKVKENSEFKVHKYQNFNLRPQIYKKTKSLFFKIYAPYVAVNRTEEPIFIHGVHNESLEGPLFMNPTSSLMIAPKGRKIKIEVEDYMISKAFLINTLGISGTIKQLKMPKKLENGPKSSLTEEEIESRKIIEIGTYISSCPHPYSRTKVIKFQPRYRVVNQIGLVIVLMQENSNHQIAVMPDDEITLNLRGGENANFLRVRLIDIAKETKKYQADNDILVNEEYKGKLTENFRNMTDRKVTEEIQQHAYNLHRALNFNQSDIRSARLTSPLEVNMNGENDMFEDQVLNDERRIVVVDKNYAAVRKDDFSVWSYKFPVKDLDDFQLSIPNKINQMLRLSEHSKGWQENDDKFFVRVNVSPSSENDATIYISFSYPMYPDYVFYNDSQYVLTLQHDSERNEKSLNEVYVIQPDQKDVVILNPVSKDKDYLLIKMFNIDQPVTTEPFHKFFYEIDSMELGVTKGMSQWHIYTKATLNLRFIHFMIEEEFIKLKQREENEMTNYQELHRQSYDQLDEFKMHEDDQVDLVFKERKIHNNVNHSNLYHNQVLNNNNHNHQQQEHDSKTHDVKIEEEKEKVQCEEISYAKQKKDEEFNDELIESSLIEMKIDLEGLGISMVDHQPRELCYISVYRPKILQFTVGDMNQQLMFDIQKFTKNKQGIEHTHRQLLFKLVNLQIDNMTPRSFPVILGPRTSLNFIERQYLDRIRKKQQEKIRVYQTIKPRALQQKSDSQNIFSFGPQQNQQSSEGDPNNNNSKYNDLNNDETQPEPIENISFLQLQFDNESFTDKKLTTQKINHFRIALTEIAINFHQYFLNQMLQFVSQITHLIPEDELAQFTHSQTMRNYNKLFELITNQEKQIELRQDGQNAVEDEDDDDIDFDYLEVDLRGVSVGGALLAEREDGIPQVLEYRDERERNNMFRSQKGIVYERRDSIFKSRQQTKRKFKRQEKVCTFISPEPIKYSKGQGIVSSKILVKEISIKALKIYLTFRVQKIQQAGTEGLGSGMLNFFMNFANVSDAQLYFTEIEVFDAYTTLEDLQTRLTKHYIKQGIEQLYQVFGATDIIGNPVSLVNNLGRGVEQLYSQPFRGAVTSHGNPLTTVIGLKDGIKSFAKLTTSGISNSVAKMSGTWYMSLANLSGRQISESNLDDPHSFPSGVYQGSKGLALEFSQGVTGVLTLPLQRVREEGRGFQQVAKGTVQGLFGFLTAPVNGILKFVHSTSAGARNQAQGLEDFRYRRMRYPRSFNEMQIMSEFESLRSHAFSALISADGGIYRNENIHLFADISEKLKKSNSRFKERILICTDERILFIQTLQKIKAEIEIKNLNSISYQKYIYKAKQIKHSHNHSSNLGFIQDSKDSNHHCGSFRNKKIILETYPLPEVPNARPHANTEVNSKQSKLIENLQYSRVTEHHLISQSVTQNHQQQQYQQQINPLAFEVNQSNYYNGYNHDQFYNSQNPLNNQTLSPYPEARNKITVTTTSQGQYKTILKPPQTFASPIIQQNNNNNHQSTTHSILEMQQQNSTIVECQIILTSKAGTHQYITSHRVNECKRFVQRVNQLLYQLQEQRRDLKLIEESQSGTFGFRNMFQDFIR